MELLNWEGFFYDSVTWSFLTAVWMTVTLLDSPRLFSVFWPILIFYSEWSTLVLSFLSPPLPVPILCCLYQVHQLQLASPSPSCLIIFQFSSKVYYFSLFSLSFSFTLWSAGTFQQFLFFLCYWQPLDLVSCRDSGRLAEIRWSVCISKS